MTVRLLLTKRCMKVVKVLTEKVGNGVGHTRTRICELHFCEASRRCMLPRSQCSMHSAERPLGETACAMIYTTLCFVLRKLKLMLPHDMTRITD